MSWYCCGLSFQRTNSEVRRPPSDSTLLPATNSELENKEPTNTTERANDSTLLPATNSQLENKEPTNTTERANDDSALTRKIHEFTLQQLVYATKRFGLSCRMDERSFGHVYRGRLRDTGEIVVVERWDEKVPKGSQCEHKEFLRQLEILSLLNHPNVITLIGYCIEGDKRILVYENTSSLYQLLHGGSKKWPPLDWTTRMKIALGIARGLECIHAASPPIIYFDLKSCNIFIDDNFNAKLFDFWQSKPEPYEDEFSDDSDDEYPYADLMIVNEYTCSTMTEVALGGYNAPDYTRTVKSDVYSFGVVLLELITGRKAKDMLMPISERNLVDWAENRMKKPKMLADPLLYGEYPAKGFSQALALVVKCLRSLAPTRPMMSEVVAAIMCRSL